MTALLAAWAAIGGSAGASTRERQTPGFAVAKAAKSGGHGRTTRRKTGACSTTPARVRAKRGANCRTAGRHAAIRHSVGRLPRPSRLRSPVTAPVPVSGDATQAGTIAKVLATPCQNTQLIPEAANLPLVRAAVLCLINTERAQNGREPLVTDPRLEQAAESHGKEMLSLDYFEHISPSGLTPVQRIRSFGYIPNDEVGYVIGENLAWGTLSLATPQSIVSAWIASPEHLANILEGKYRDTGIDVEPQVPEELAEGVAGALYTQEFGVIVH
jgi:uncharacterized protein YkwD